MDEKPSTCSQKLTVPFLGKDSATCWQFDASGCRTALSQDSAAPRFREQAFIAAVGNKLETVFVRRKNKNHSTKTIAVARK